jgi:rod shape-determining protein MreC
MQNLIQFLFRNGAFFLFLLLELVCLFLVVRNNDSQKSIYLNSSNILIGKIYDRYDGFVRYWNLNEVVDSLSKENAKLKSSLYNRPGGAAPNYELSPDTAQSPKYQLIEARVINNSISSRNNNLTIDKGKNQGIEKGMGIISSNGIVGIVTGISNSFSRVMSILHSDARISASIKRTNYFGSLVWKGFNPQKMHLEAIPKHANIQLGDTVQTSGYSHIYPEGIMIGVIEKFRIDKGGNFYTIEVKLRNDLSNLQQVYTIQNMLKHEQMKLENSDVDD